ncbi:MAG: sugar phosphate nucleotidyltransferase [Clostridia bacterium]|nr:sugar phosphate nucleotidyltransferase [Clostridia bacterium]
MRKPMLVILAAGLGNRFGGGSAKQIAPVDGDGHIMMEFSMYDAMRAGFTDVVCVIREDMEADFHAQVGARAAKFLNLSYAHQRYDMLPVGHTVPVGRDKPWGTAHAMLCAKALVNGPYAVINADDFYGRDAYARMYGFLSSQRAETEYAMVGYTIEKVVTESGSVSRGVCEVSPDGMLTAIYERTRIFKRSDGAAYTEDGEHFVPLPKGTVVSMNIWGFQRSMMEAMETLFAAFLRREVPKDPLRAEYYLPTAVSRLLKRRKATVCVLETDGAWYGVTYRQDLPAVQTAIARMKRAGIYPSKLWE